VVEQRSAAIRSGGSVGAGAGAGSAVADVEVAHENIISSQAVIDAMAKMDQLGFPPVVAGNWDSGLPYLNVSMKGADAPWLAGIMLPLRMIDISRVQAAVRAVPPSWWEPHTAATENVQLGLREGNVAQFKPGVKAIIMQFSDQSLDHTYVYPWYEHFKDAVAPILDAVLGPGNRNKVVRMQFALMPVGSTIKMHRDMGGYALKAHRIHVPVITHEKVSFQSCPRLEKRHNGRGSDLDVTEPDDCVTLPMQVRTGASRAFGGYTGNFCGLCWVGGWDEHAVCGKATEVRNL